MPIANPVDRPSQAVTNLCIITSRMQAPCDNCGRLATPVHMPRQEHGLYCGDCCPACSKAVVPGRK